MNYPKLVYRIIEIYFMLTLTMASLTATDNVVEPVRKYNKESPLLKNHIIYDQRQSGKYNLQLVLKDITIIQLDKNNVDKNYADDVENDNNNNNDDDDNVYYYDDAHLTVKPINWTSINIVKDLQKKSHNITNYEATIIPSLPPTKMITTIPTTTTDIITTEIIQSLNKVESIQSDHANSTTKPLNILQSPYQTQQTDIELSKANIKEGNDYFINKQPKLSLLKDTRSYQNNNKPVTTLSWNSKKHRCLTNSNNKSCRSTSTSLTSKSLLKRLISVLMTLPL